MDSTQPAARHCQAETPRACLCSAAILPDLSAITNRKKSNGGQNRGKRAVFLDKRQTTESNVPELSRNHIGQTAVKQHKRPKPPTLKVQSVELQVRRQVHHPGNADVNETTAEYGAAAHGDDAEYERSEN